MNSCQTCARFYRFSNYTSSSNNAYAYIFYIPKSYSNTQLTSIKKIVV